MKKFFNNFDNKFNGWPKTILIIICEIILIYFLSNIPFILATLEAPINPTHNIGFFDSFVDVLRNEINKGQLLTFVCVLIAPVVFWSIIEFKKTLMTKLLSFSAFILLAVSAYLHGKGEEFNYFNSFNLYQAALIIWVLSVFSNRIPPDRKSYGDIANDQLQEFLKETK